MMREHDIVIQIICKRVDHAFKKISNTPLLADLDQRHHYHSSLFGYVWPLILLPLCLSDMLFVCALTYLDYSSRHTKTITTIFLVMRLSAGTRGYGTHIQTSHDMTHPPNSVSKYVPDVNDTMSRILKAFTSLRKL